MVVLVLKSRPHGLGRLLLSQIDHLLVIAHGAKTFARAHWHSLHYSNPPFLTQYQPRFDIVFSTRNPHTHNFQGNAGC